LRAVAYVASAEECALLPKPIAVRSDPTAQRPAWVPSVIWTARAAMGMQEYLPSLG